MYFSLFHFTFIKKFYRTKFYIRQRFKKKKKDRTTKRNMHTLNFNDTCIFLFLSFINSFKSIAAPNASSHER